MERVLLFHITHLSKVQTYLIQLLVTWVVVNERGKPPVVVWVLPLKMMLIEPSLDLCWLSKEPELPLKQLLLLIAWDIRKQEEP